MVEKAKIFYFTVFILVVAAFIFHVTAMGHHHWKKVVGRNASYQIEASSETTIGLFTRCTSSNTDKIEACFPNLFPTGGDCNYLSCLSRTPVAGCSCDFLQSTKAIASCAIIAAIFLGLSIIILFIHSINTSETRSLSLILGLVPLLFLILAFAFILTTLILVGCFLSRDIMHILGYGTTNGTYMARSYRPAVSCAMVTSPSLSLFQVPISEPLERSAENDTKSASTGRRVWRSSHWS